MPSPGQHRLSAGIAAAAVAGLLLAVLPPVVGRGVPPTLVRTRPVDLSALMPGAAPGAVHAEHAVRTRRAVACAPIPFTAAALTWRGEGHLDLEVAWGNSRRFGAPILVEADPTEGPDPGTPDDRGTRGTPLLWTGWARCLRFRLHLPAGAWVRDLRAAFIDSSSLWPAERGAAAMTSQPKVLLREEWGADESLRNCGPFYADALKMAFVHHTATGNDYGPGKADDVVRSIYSYHTQVRGFCDIAYQFLIDRFGRIYEGRYGGMDRPVNGAHAQGFNTGSAGVAVIGTFTGERPPRDALRSLKRLLAWRLDAAHLPPTGMTRMVSGGGNNQRFEAGENVRLPVIAGHRDTGYTECPGGRLYALLDDLRPIVARIGLPKIYRAVQSASEVVIGESASHYTARLSEEMRWFVDVADGDGVRVWRATGRGQRLDATWDGTDGNGVPVPPGTYTATAWSRVIRTGPFALPATFTVTVSYLPSPSPTPTPSPSPPG